MEKIPQHSLPQDFQLKSILETDIGMLYFYNDIVVFEANEGIVLSYKTGFSILLQGLNYLGAKPWVYISNRIHSYSIETMDYKYLNKVPTLKAVAIVSYSEIGHLNAELEAKFCEKPIKIFDNLHEAAIWVKEFIIK